MTSIKEFPVRLFHEAIVSERMLWLLIYLLKKGKRLQIACSFPDNSIFFKILEDSGQV